MSEQCKRANIMSFSNTAAKVTTLSMALRVGVAIAAIWPPNLWSSFHLPTFFSTISFALSHAALPNFPLAVPTSHAPMPRMLTQAEQKGSRKCRGPTKSGQHFQSRILNSLRLCKVRSLEHSGSVRLNRFFLDFMRR